MDIRHLSSSRITVYVWTIFAMVLLDLGTGGVGRAGGGIEGKEIGSQQCPHMCTCDIKTQAVDCSRQRLVSVPNDVPLSVVTLYMRTNSFNTLISSSLLRFITLKVLDFQNNSIATIEPNAFRNLYQLERLNLRDNKLTIIHPESFLHLVKLKQLDLTNNPIRKVSSTAFTLMPDLQNVNLRNSPLNCDCEEAFLQEWQDRRQGLTGMLTLEEPRCQNYGNEMLSTAVNRYRNRCPESQGPSICPLCNNVSSAEQCKDQETCSNANAACGVTLHLGSGSLNLSSGCGAESTCTQILLPSNIDECPPSGDGRCQLCCTPPNCFLPTLIQGYSNKEVYDVEYYLDEPWDENYKNDKSAEFKLLAGTLESETENALKSLDKEKCDLQIHVFENFMIQIRANGRLRCKLANDMTPAELRDKIYRLLEEADFSLKIELIVVHSNSFCPENIITDPQTGDIYFPSTMPGQNVTSPCYLNPGETATGFCVPGIPGEGAHWDHETSRCEHFDDRSRSLSDLTKRPVTNESVTDIVQELADLTSDVDDFTSIEVKLVADIVKNITQAHDVVYEPPVGGQLLESINNMLLVDLNILVEAEKEMMCKSVTRLIYCSEMIGQQLKLAPEAVVKMVESKMAMSVAKVAEGGSLLFEVTGDIEDDLSKDRMRISRTLNNDRPPQDPTLFKKGEFRDRSLKFNKRAAPNVVASIALPASVVAMGSREDSTNFMIYNLEAFFEAAGQASEMPDEISVTPNEDIQKPVLNSRVVTAMVGRHNLTNLHDPVTITLSHVDKNGTNPQCVFWDFSVSRWSKEGCRVSEERAESTVCQCDHLTNFALLMDIFGTAGDIGENHKIALSYISYIGCGISMLGLILTLITYFSFRKLLKDNPAKILVNLCIALLGILIGFVLGTQLFVRNSDIACKVFAGFTHYFVLSSMLWMVIEAFYMYIALVKVFHTHYSRFILKCCFIGWGIPLVVVGVTVGISRENYGLQGEICWLAHIPFLVALMAPVALILILNFVAFGLVMNQLRQMDNKKIEKSKRSNILSRLRGAISVMVLLGLTWIFAFFAIGGASIVFHYLFAIFNSLQGLFIFVFYCFLKKEAQNTWLQCMGCVTFSGHSQSSSKGSSNQSRTASSQLEGSRHAGSRSAIAPRPQAMTAGQRPTKAARTHNQRATNKM